MVETESRKLIENEAKFREYNEEVDKGFKEMERKAKEEGWDVDVPPSETKVYFYCECSDENCKKRIQMSMRQYGKIHENRSHFIVLYGHETPKVELVVEKGDTYCVVEKKRTPPEYVAQLHDTDVDNA